MATGCFRGIQACKLANTRDLTHYHRRDIVEALDLTKAVTAGICITKAARPWLIQINMKSAPPAIPFDTPVTGMDLTAVLKICNRSEERKATQIN